MRSDQHYLVKMAEVVMIKHLPKTRKTILRNGAKNINERKNKVTSDNHIVSKQFIQLRVNRNKVSAAQKHTTVVILTLLDPKKRCCQAKKVLALSYPGVNFS